MQIVIDIDENLYTRLFDNGKTNVMDMRRACVAIRKGTPLDKIRAEIEEKYGDYDICEWFEDYDYEENDISEYQQVGNVLDILAIIDKYREGK